MSSLRTPVVLAAALLPSLALAVPITAYTLLLPGQVVSDVLHDVADAGDLNLDGLTDQMIGDPLDGPAGTVGIRYGGPPPFPGLVPPVQLFGQNPGDQFGIAVDGVGDVNCDGFDDVVVGAPRHLGVGAAFVWFGPLAPGAYPAATANLVLLGELPGDAAGTSVQLLPDMDGDTCAEIAIGAPGFDVGSLTDAGAGYVVFSSSGYVGPTPLNPGTAMRFDGMMANARMGHAIDKASDLDGDGREDLLLGAPGLFGTGGAHVGFGPWGRYISGGSPANIAVAGLTLAGELPGDQAGWSVDGGFDVDLDGVPDLLVGAPRHTLGAGAFQAGAAYLVSGITLPAAPGASVPLPPHSEKWVGTYQGGNLGWDVSFLYDVTNDGFPDWAASAPWERLPTGGGGRVYANASPGAVVAGGVFFVPGGPSVDAVTNFLGVGYAIDGGRNSDGDVAPDPIVGFFYEPLFRNGLVTF